MRLLMAAVSANISLTLVLCHLSLFSLASAHLSLNQCRQSRYLTVRTNDADTKINSNLLSDITWPVGNQSCAFKITGFISYAQSTGMVRLVDECQHNYHIDYVAVTLNKKAKNVCQFWSPSPMFPGDDRSTEVICVCDFYKCNSLPGILFENLIRSYSEWKAGTGLVADQSSTTEIQNQSKIDKHITCLLLDIMKVYNQGMILFDPNQYRSNLDKYLKETKIRLPQMFPTDEEKSRLIKEGEDAMTTTSTTSSSTTTSTTTTPLPNTTESDITEGNKEGEEATPGFQEQNRFLLMAGSGAIVVLVTIISVGGTIIYTKRAQRAH